jgi:hypothetical protein
VVRSGDRLRGVRLKVGIVQSSFIPWRGYFDFIASVDKFVFLEDVQYTARDWRNRNRIKSPGGSIWLTVPVLSVSREQLIQDTRIDYSRPWIRKHRAAWNSNYARARYLSHTEEILATMSERTYETISELNIALIGRICQYLGIATPTLASSSLSPMGTKTTRLIDILRKLGATAYVSGPSADGYLDKQAFSEEGIQLEYKSYDYAPYPQLWGDFDGAVSVLDLIANCGPESPAFLRSQTLDRVVVPSRAVSK